MKLVDSSNGIRFGLYIFIFLIVFCLAQLTWWIIYQLDLNRQIYNHRISLLTLKAESLADRVNHDFRRLADLADYSYRLNGGNPAELQKCLNNLLSDQAVIGYHISGTVSGLSETGGRIDSTFFYAVGGGATLYFDPEYPSHLLPVSPPQLNFKGPVQSDGKSPSWVSADMFQIIPEVRADIERESRKGAKMFIFEGGFFMLIVLTGAYMIYRTLQKSEDLKARQANFIQSVTHEFRTPLTSLRLYLETLDSGKLEPSQTRQLYGKMLDDCDRLDGMVDNVLEAGHFGREKRDLNLTETVLSQDLEEYLDSLRPYISRHNGALQTEIEDKIAVRSDYQALGRAIRAVVDNALKYSPPDRRDITVSLKKSGRYAVVTVSDRGIGIPPAEQKKIFERFYRITDSSLRSVKGTGLGLYLVRHIIEAHDGKIEVVSEGVDKGTSIIIKLPLVDA